ncbi:MAG: HAD-IB family phosphatase [Vulcanimicrobiaceae bacterium]
MRRRDARQTAIFSDFNGTITDRDTLPTLLEAYGLREAVDRTNDARATGVLNHRERIAAQARALTQSIEEAAATLNSIVRFDAGFTRLQAACAHDGIALTVLSSGLEQLIRPMLRRHGCDAIALVANEAEPRSDGWRVRFRDTSPHGCAKQSYLERARRRGMRTVAIGDDESDFEMAAVADLCFAKRESALQAYLRGTDRTHYAYATFDDVIEQLASLGILRA